MQFKYTAIDLQKAEYNGILLAEDEKELASLLSQQGLYLVSCSPYSGRTKRKRLPAIKSGARAGELATFCRQYSVMLYSGVSLLDGIKILKEQKFSWRFGNALQMVYTDVKGGMMLSEAFAKHEDMFPQFFCAMIRVGEASGKLDTVMSSLAEHYEKDTSLRRKVKSALAYPAVLMAMTVAVIILMLVYVMPTFRSSLSSLGIEPTGVSKAVYDISDFLTVHWYKILLAIAAVAIAIYAFSRTGKGRLMLDRLYLSLPMVKGISSNLIAARFARAFGLLLSSGMNMSDALENVIIVLGNRYAEAQFAKASTDVSHGALLANAIERHMPFLPAALLQMIAVGERSASLDETLLTACSFFDDTVDSRLNAAVTVIQPFIMLILGGVIAVMFIAAYSPMLTMMNGI